MSSHTAYRYPSKAESIRISFYDHQYDPFQYPSRAWTIYSTEILFRTDKHNELVTIYPRERLNPPTPAALTPAALTPEFQETLRFYREELYLRPRWPFELETFEENPNELFPTWEDSFFTQTCFSLCMYNFQREGALRLQGKVCPLPPPNAPKSENAAIPKVYLDALEIWLF